MERTAFLIVTKELLKDKQLSATAKLLLAQLLDHRNKTTGQCNPRIKTLAEELGVSQSTAGRALRELREARLVKITWSSRSSRYEILFGQIDRSCSVKLTEQPRRSLYELDHIGRAAREAYVNGRRNGRAAFPPPKKSMQSEVLERYYAMFGRKAGEAQ